ncbi:MAG: hypothetical protein QXP47_03150 [Candidatus Nezhaarchaeales archaeon]|nr:MAG: hypothetical protein DSO06_03670 [Candidatus Nezhaarchaeota archaeon WYZ-LMO8]TDA37079.1 MAG: hypothetical protein DSO05_01290 [Candidatus Nezhaarchaeota archaeon WYZ-LMO7]
MKENYGSERFLRLLNEHRREGMLVNLDVARNMKEVIEELVAIKRSLIRRHQGSNMLIKLGLACLAFPEPLISNIIGGTLVTLGYYVEKARGCNDLKGLLEAVRELKPFLTSHT